MSNYTINKYYERSHFLPEPILTVLLITYNHEHYFVKAIESILKQKTNFDFKIHILDDCSTDGTTDLVKEYAQKYSDKIIPFIREKNCGVMENIYQGLLEINTEFFAMLESDDYWCDNNKLQLAVDKLRQNPDCVMFGHNTKIIRKNEELYCVSKKNGLEREVPTKFRLEPFKTPPYLHFSSRVYRNIFNFKNIPKEIVSWDIGIYYLFLDKGCCYYHDKVMSVYNNMNESSIFYNAPLLSQYYLSINVFYKFNKYFNFKYDNCLVQNCPYSADLIRFKNDFGIDEGWKNFIKLIDYIAEKNEKEEVKNVITIPECDYKLKHSIVNKVSKFLGLGKIIVKDANAVCSVKKIKTDLLIFDDVFPHKLSPFRYVEYTEYLNHFKNILISATGYSLSWLQEKKTIYQLVNEFILEKTKYINKLKVFKPSDKFDAKLIYVNFLGNAIQHGLANNLKTPFVINLYPGGMFQLNDKKIDSYLKEIFSSPYFRRVIVTQKITYDYLIKNEFCKPEQIEFIFGVVIPEEMLNLAVTDKKRFGFEKDTLDICFVAHKYTEFGQDKGYDKFIETAHNLVKKHNNINFHVVGSFDENILDVSKLGNKIKFYGLQRTEWFVDFYKDKDIILSPNVPFKITNGSFDGFPTACVTDAGLNEVAMFATDELKLNEGRFVENEDIIIIKPTAEDIEEKIEYYYNHPEKLKNISINGAKKIKELYSFKNQIYSRIEILEKELYGENKFIEKVRSVINRNLNNNYLDIGYIPTFSDKIQNNNGAVEYFYLGEWKERLIKISELYYSLADENSKDLLVLICAYKILGPTKIKLPLYDKNKWQGYFDLENNIIEKTDVESYTGKFNIYNLKHFGYNIKLLYSQFGAFLSFILEQYRYKDICKAEKGDFVIDGGACYGDSALYFADLVGKNGKVFSFEFIQSNIEIFNKNMELNIEHKKRIELIERPLGKNSTDILFGAESGPGSSLSMNFSENSKKYITVSIDDMVIEKNIKKIDFIKMDIEGSEIDAINGATETIKKFKPKLAIAVYHKDDDFITIPALIKKINPNYKFYIGHYTAMNWETVLYAVNTKD